MRLGLGTGYLRGTPAPSRGSLVAETNEYGGVKGTGRL